MQTALTIAGSDCSGGAGIQADLKTFSANGVFGMSVIVSVVAENTCRVIGIEDISPAMIQQQIDAVFEDIEVNAVKIGMLNRPESMRAVAQKIAQYHMQNVVLDPVMIAKNGSPLMQPEAMDTLKREVLPLCDLLTPNIPEAEEITGMRIETVAQMEQAAHAIAQLGPKAVLVKGGHKTGDAVDVLFDGVQITHFAAQRIETKNTHGTGCTYSSAIAAHLARGANLQQAVLAAKHYVTTAIAHALPLGHGHGPTHHFYELYEKSGLNDTIASQGRKSQ